MTTPVRPGTEPGENSQRPSPAANALYKLLAILVLLGSFVLAWLIMDFRAFLTSPLVVSTPVHLSVAPGSTLREVAAELARRGALERPLFLVLLGRWQGKAQSIKAGEYQIEPGTTPSELLDQLVAGKVVQHSLTVVEGWSFAQLMGALRADDTLGHTLEGLDEEQIMARIGHEGEHPEGRFFPDTYRFPRGTTDVAFLQRAYRLMATHLSREWHDRDQGLPYRKPYEALIMASIIEKETAVPGERAQIAGVFVRRLQRHMRLQTDPTVIYGLGASFDGNLRARDLTRDTPYNTYVRTGLPPTPIALPGVAALHAALHPSDGDALFFVARGDGSHQFSATLEEHNRAVREYQLNGRSAPALRAP